MEKALTVFTPTYNRAYCLHQLYNSLCRQTSIDFEWLIIDDGSTDNTSDLVNGWIADSRIQIKYHFKENGGMHTGHNAAYDLITTEYNLCIDSDDFMPDNGVQIILNELKLLPEDYAGLVGLDADQSGNIIGTAIPYELKRCKLNDLYSKYEVRGDKKLVYKTEIIKKYPAYPVFERERFVPLDYKYLLIDQDYDLKPINEILCIVEYRDDGSTMNIFSQYRKNPRGFAFSRLNRIQLGRTFKERYRNAIHLVSCALFTKDVSLLNKARSPSLVLLAFLPGVLLNLYTRVKARS